MFRHLRRCVRLNSLFIGCGGQRRLSRDTPNHVSVAWHTLELVAENITGDELISVLGSREGRRPAAGGGGGGGGGARQEGGDGDGNGNENLGNPATAEAAGGANGSTHDSSEHPAKRQAIDPNAQK